MQKKLVSSTSVTMSCASTTSSTSTENGVITVPKPNKTLAEIQQGISQLGIKGKIYYRGHEEYAEHAYQYASSSCDNHGSMRPAAVIYPTNNEDIKRVINFARECNIAVAVRTGGHQYSGASSTFGPNIQIDMTFANENDWNWDPDTSLLTTSVGHSLSEFNEKIKKLGIFVPHGQCSHVAIGGHLSTGGYGQLSRAFGLFSDHIKSFQIITADGNEQQVSQTSDPDLFYAVLGGSPGNFGVVTHITLQMRKDGDHPESRGLKKFCEFSDQTLKTLLDIEVEMMNSDNFPPDFDYCVTVMSKAGDKIDTLDAYMRKNHKEQYEEDAPFFSVISDGLPTNYIVVYAQWANADGAADESAIDNATKWFNKISEASEPSGLFSYFKAINSFAGFSHKEHIPMSKLMNSWIYPFVREFPMPYDKRTYLTAYTDELKTNGWSKTVSEHTKKVMDKESENGCRLTLQIQVFGGEGSQFSEKGKDGATSYSWREDTSIVAVMDIFYNPNDSKSKDTAHNWQETNDNNYKTMFGKERSVLWGSHGEPNLHTQRHRYYDSEKKYERLVEIKKSRDPGNVFTPNAFCVGFQESKPIEYTIANLPKIGDLQTESEVDTWDDEKGLRNNLKIRSERHSHTES